MDNQHKLIKGYRDLSQKDIDQMNQCKALAEEVGSMCDALEEKAKAERGSVDMRWLSIARTDLQKGFMSMIRSVAKPTTF